MTRRKASPKQAAAFGETDTPPAASSPALEKPAPESPRKSGRKSADKAPDLGSAVVVRELRNGSGLVVFEVGAEVTAIDTTGETVLLSVRYPTVRGEWVERTGLPYSEEPQVGTWAHAPQPD